MTSQKGSTHVILIIGLVVALIGSLGFIFWQNYIKKDSTDSKVSQAQKKETAAQPEIKADPRIETKQKISAWINMNSSTDLLPYMNPTVDYAIANSDGILNDSPKEQVLSNTSSYLAGHVNKWVSQDFAKITNQEKFLDQAKQDTYFDFANSYVSLNTSSDSQDFAAFKIDDTGLITDVYLGTVVNY